MSEFKYVIKLIEEQMELMQDEFRFAEGEEMKELQQRYKDCNEAHLVLKGVANGAKTSTDNALLADVGVCTCGTEEHAEYMPRDNGMIHCRVCEKPY